MSGLAGVLAIAFTMVFTENYVLVQFLGICPFLGVSQKLSSSLGMSGAVIFVMTLASAVTYLIYTYIMVPLGLAYLSTIIFILVIAALVQFVEIFLKRFVHPLYSALGIYLPLITTNCAVLAVTLLNISENYNLLESCIDGFAAGVGFGLALVLFSGVRKALERAKPPACWNGLPITLVAAALTSMTFMGFTGIADNLFG
ncbi:MAG: RnfABCDGE type electron transport complex subunit A [Oscillospiraceae bacterium]|nr:RnfABCDGE type electron transport complex subunit A [Oscillospiraceae bacterium]